MTKDPKHIAIFDHIFLMGGVERVFLNYAEVLVNRGYSVDLVVCRADRELLKLVPQGVRVVELGDATFRSVARKLRRYLKTSSAATIITGQVLDNFSAIWVNLWRAKAHKINVIVSQHSVPNADDSEAGLLGKFFPIGKRLLYRFANSVIAVSQGVAQSLRDGGVPAHKIHVIENPIDIEQIELDAQCEPSITMPARYIAFVGRLHTVKNVEFLIRSYGYIELIDLELVIVGDGPLRKSLEDQARQSAKSKKIHFVGNITNPAPIVASASVVAVCSTSEAFPMVVLESLTLGKTIAHTPNLGCVEILGSDYGYCSNTFDDAQEFADLMVAAIENPIDPQKLRAQATLFDKSNFATKIEKLLPLR